MLALLAFAGESSAEGYILSVGADADSTGGRSITALGEFGIGENTWLSFGANASRTDGISGSNENVLANLSLDHWFDPFGVRIGAAYWGNADVLDSRDFDASVYLRGEGGFLSLEYQKRNFEFDLQSDMLRGRTAKFRADGVGLTARINLTESVNVRISGMRYDYSRNLRLQRDINLLSFFARSRLSAVNSLVDDRVSAGIEYDFGLRSIDLSAGRWTTAVDGSRIDSISLGFLTPVSDRFDMEFRLATDDSDSFGQTTSLSVYLYYFGGA